jgi:hypothetical protein
MRVFLRLAISHWIASYIMLAAFILFGSAVSRRGLVVRDLDDVIELILFPLVSGFVLWESVQRFAVRNAFVVFGTYLPAFLVTFLAVRWLERTLFFRRYSKCPKCGVRLAAGAGCVRCDNQTA